MSSKITRLSGPPGEPPRPLGEAGRRFWNGVQGDYLIDDAGDVELLTQISEALDRIAAFREIIAREGLTVTGPRGGLLAHPLLTAEASARSFIARSIRALGLGYEPTKPMGRPPAGGWRG